MRVLITSSLLMATLATTGCQERPTAPSAASPPDAASAHLSTANGPNYDLDVILRGVGTGQVAFRQPGGHSQHIVFLTVGVSDLAPHTAYVLQRAVDTNLDGNCTGTSWLTLGRGPTPQAIFTDDKGMGTGELYRILSTSGSTFDIHFRVVQAHDMTLVVLTSDCYQFTVK